MLPGEGGEMEPHPGELPSLVLASCRKGASNVGFSQGHFPGPFASPSSGWAAQAPLGWGRKPQFLSESPKGEGGAEGLALPRLGLAQ